MARFSLTRGPGALAAGAGAFALVAGAVYLVLPREDEPAPVTSTPLLTVPQEAAKDTEASPATEEIASPVPERRLEPEPEPEPEAREPVPDVPAPSFDLVRAEASGQVLVAGKAAPGHQVRLSVDGTEEARTDADAGGGFVLFLDLPVWDAPRVLDLIAVGPDGTERRAEESVILAPPRRPAEVAADDAVGALAPEIAAAAEAPATSAQVRADASLGPEPDAVATQAAPAEVAPGASAPALSAPQGVSVAADVAEAQPPVQGRTAPELAPGQVAELAPGQAAELAPELTSSRAEPEANIAAAAISPDTAPVDAADASAPVSASPSVAPAAGLLAAVPPPPARAPSVLVARREGVGLLQPSGGAPRLNRVVIDVISYDEEGTVMLEGRSAAPPPPVDSVRVYLDNAPVQTARIDADGSWRLPLRDVASGIYTLRVDQLDSAGNVVSRFETPFKREDPVNLARLEAQQPEADGSVAVSVITVQPGYTLWGIASDRYGDGFRYVAIFEANDDQIRDPDLIYPGQVFDLPDLDAPN